MTVKKSKADKILRGSRLQNGTGAIVLEKRPDWRGEGCFVVLCIIPRQRQYATWWMNQQGQTFHGHYTLGLKDAIKEFEARP